MEMLSPFLLVRFGLLGLLDRQALVRASYFAPMEGRERAAYWAFQLMTALILALMLLLPVRMQPCSVFILGVLLYLAGLALLGAAVVAYAHPADSGMNRGGVYRWSRNPMYVAYFLLFCGCALLTQSALMLAAAVVFQLAAHIIIRAEERWCLARFGREYAWYMRKVRRYF